jgi:hypothetical protein
MSWLHTAGTLFWTVFALTFLGVAIWGSARPERALLESTEGRWTRHVLLFAASFLVSAVLLPITRFDCRRCIGKPDRTPE